MNTAEFLTHLRTLGIEIKLDEGRLRCIAPKGVLTPDLQQEIAKRKPELISALREAQQSGPGRLPALTRSDIGDEQPLSFAQERLWFLHRLHPTSSAYNLAASWNMPGKFDADRVQQSLVELTRRHEILRATFPERAGVPVQVISPIQDVPLKVVDIRSASTSERDDRLDRIGEEEASCLFDLVNGPLFRCSVVLLHDNEYVVYLHLHHIICDGWSVGVLKRDFTEIMKTARQSSRTSLDEMPLRYCDYANWQREWLTGDALERLLSFWKSQLEDVTHVLPLPTDRPRPDIHNMRGAVREFQLTADLSTRIQEECREQQATPFVILLGAFGTLLSRYSGAQKFVVGSPFANRTRKELDDMVGLFVNTLALRIDVSGDPSSRELTTRLQEMLLDVHEHQDMPFEKIVDAVSPDRTMSHSPLFQVAIVLHNTPGVAEYSYRNSGSIFDLTLFLWHDGTFRGAFEYNPQLFDESTIDRLIANFKTLASEFVSMAETPVSRLCVVSDDEATRLTSTWNETVSDYPRNSTVADLFEEQVARTPHAVAIQFASQQLTYEELNQRADQVAARLRASGVGFGSFVGLCVDRSVEMVVATLAILKADGVYVPLDADYPRDRLSYMIEDSGISLLICTRKLSEQLPTDGAELFLIDELCDPQSDATNIEPWTRRSTADDLIYIMYTSGSTGVPKGVCVRHRGVARLVKNTNYVHIDTDDVFFQYAPMSFDAATFEIWGSLLNGARLAIAPPRLLSIAELCEEVRQQEVTILWLTAGLFHQVVDHGLHDLSGLKQLLAGGDVLSPRHVRKALANLNDCALINGYGPTENTTFTCCHRMTSPEEVDLTVPIGRPISNSSVYVLDQADQPVPTGAIGQLCAAGDGLAAGYLNDAELTEQRFVHNPFRPGERLYRTGDHVRYRADGVLEFVGRIDNQVKVRGFRIELGEIEKALDQHVRIRRSVVIKQQEEHQQTLVAFLEVDGERPTIRQLRHYLKQRLPAHMIPEEFVALRELPVTSNGKVDRTALPAMSGERPELDDDFVAPKTKSEIQLAEIWCDLLKKKEVGARDNFFELGGNSLQAAVLCSRIEERFGTRLPLSTLFHAPDIQSLAVAIHYGCAASRSDLDLLVPFRSEGDRPPMFFVHGVGGEVFGFKVLSGYLSSNQPIYALRVGSQTFDCIEDLARFYLEYVRAVAPRGPIVLGGYSLGAAIAYEMAQQIVESGHKPPLVVAFDSTLPNLPDVVRPGRIKTLIQFFRLLPHWIVGDLFKTPLPRTYNRILGHLSSWFRRDADDLNVRAVFGIADLPEILKGQYTALFDAWRRYHPVPYAGRVLLLRGRTPALFGRWDQDLGWRTMVDDRLIVSVLPGSHMSLLEEPFVRDVAKVLEQRAQECLAPAAMDAREKAAKDGRRESSGSEDSLIRVRSGAV